MIFKHDAAISLDKWGAIETQEDGSLKVGNMGSEGFIIYETISQADLDSIETIAATLKTDFESKDIG